MVENFSIGWQLLVLGMGTVFLVLYFLSVILKYMGNYLRYKPLKKKEKIPVQNDTSQIDINKNAKIAAVMAAIQVVMGDTSYRVISIKKKGSSTWKQAINLIGQEFNYGRRKGT
ncbi:hypothetical protein BBF96_05025 [Anoxybacter fermentans]|uniref:Oxaloacetate decarboxylase gamma chain n=1 Tax=Anoxybacter fermentans TaxID=1323375 RepID=A0A3Q9HPT4_9FIRM|nr:OadG family protein [Anoxybacter fermentans]AZR72810.1 hypothetical protein BBF96_05025 [Anoxybacter fermentans]